MVMCTLPTHLPTLDFYSFCKANSKMLVFPGLSQAEGPVCSRAWRVRGWERQRKEGVRALSGAKVDHKARYTGRTWREAG